MRICSYKVAIMKHMDWDDLRFFLAVANAGSLSAAARGLNVNTTTVLRRIANLEEALDARLFERLRSGYELTQDGTRLLETLEPVDLRLSSLHRDFKSASEDYRGIVRLSTSEMIGGNLLGPSIARLVEQMPDVGLDIVTEARMTSASFAPRVLSPLRDVDIALRLERPTQGDMLVRKLADIGYGLYAHEDYIARFGTVPAGGDLSGHQIIGFSEEERPLGPIWWLSRAERAGNVIMRSSSPMTRAGAVQTASGIAALPCFYAQNLPQVQPVAGPALLGTLELWMLTRSDLARLGHVRAVMDFLIAEVQAKSRVLAGA
ncbi:LysR family transcriptional regulator [Alphaproteobacteria bacterium]|nr:LysR family transcriptional regulator [Alphaproteobacteria bacterium]